MKIFSIEGNIGSGKSTLIENLKKYDHLLLINIFLILVLFTIKNNYPDLYVYLLNKYEKPIENKGVSCRAKFIFFNEHEITDTLKAEGLDGFKLKLKSHDFYLCRIIFIRHGESISADFENNDMIALTSNNHHQ